MEKHKNKSTRAKRGGLDESEINAQIPSDTGELGEQWENSVSGAGESGSTTEKPKSASSLWRVGVGSWDEHKSELDRLQAHLARTSEVRIARATVNSKTAPITHETGHGEIMVTIADEFTALLTDGTTLTAA